MKTGPALPERRRFDTQGLLAIDPSAFGMLFDCFAPPAAPFTLAADGKAAIVDVRGPLQTAGWFCDTYDAIRARVGAALESGAECVILRVASPGGDVFGCFDTAKALRAMAAAAGKPLYGYTGANACSSAYALLSACSSISASSSAVLGSIGVIATATDASEQAKAAGLRFTIVTSGARKADGNPMVPISDDARAAMQRQVDAMAGVFFDLVAEHRGIAAAPLEASTFVGEAAMAEGLCDRVESFDAMLEAIASGAMLSGKGSPMPKAEDKKDEKKDEAREALAAAAKAGNAKAAKALKAYDESDEKAEEKKDDEKAAEPDKAEKAAVEKKDEKAEFPEKKEKAEEKKDDEKALAATAAKNAIRALRPDLTDTFVAPLMALDVETFAKVLAAAPRSTVKASTGVVEPERAPTRGDSQKGNHDRLPRAEAAALDEQMGITDFESANVDDSNGVVFSFGVKRPKVS